MTKVSKNTIERRLICLICKSKVIKMSCYLCNCFIYLYHFFPYVDNKKDYSNTLHILKKIKF